MDSLSLSLSLSLVTRCRERRSPFCRELADTCTLRSCTRTFSSHVRQSCVVLWLPVAILTSIVASFRVSEPGASPISAVAGAIASLALMNPTSQRERVIVERGRKGLPKEAKRALFCSASVGTRWATTLDVVCPRVFSVFLLISGKECRGGHDDECICVGENDWNSTLPGESVWDATVSTARLAETGSVAVVADARPHTLR